MKKNFINLRYTKMWLSKKALEAVEELNNGGSVNTMQFSREELNDIGLCYCYGHIVSLNYEEAVKWFLMSARKHFKGAELNLYRCYRWGWGVMPDMEAAMYWLRKAVKHNSASAQFDLAEHYFDGFYLKKNRRLAKLWYAKSVENAFREESAILLNVLGSTFYKGERGFQIDKEMAIKCFEKAAEQQMSLSIFWLIIIYREEGDREKVEYWTEKYRKCPNKDKLLTGMIERLAESERLLYNLRARDNETEPPIDS